MNHRSRLRCLLVPLLVMACLGGCDCGGRVNRRAPPTIGVAPTLIDFGQVPIGQSAARTLKVSNSGQDPLQVFELLFEQDLLVFSTETPSFHVEGGQEISVTVQFAPAQARSHSGRLVIENNSSNAAVMLVQLTGEGIAAPPGDGGSPDGGVDAGPVIDGGGLDACTPSCIGLACGAYDGCGGSCQPGSGCTGSDACTPVCLGVECGATDGCGGRCQPGLGCNQADAGACTGVAPTTVTCSLAISGDRRAVPAVADDGTVYLNGRHTNPGTGKVQPSLLAIQNCAQLWEFVPPDPDLSTCNAPVIRADGQVLLPCLASGSSLPAIIYVVQPNGILQSTMPLAAGLAPTHLALGANGTLYMGHRQVNGPYYAYTSSGALKWVLATGGSQFRLASAIDGSGKVHAGTWHYPGQPPSSPFATVFSITDNVTSGSLAWTFQAPEDIGPNGAYPVMLNSAPALGADGTLYVGIVGTLNGNMGTTLYALDPSNGGAEKWRYTVQNNPMSMNAHLAIGADGTIYLVSSDFNSMVLSAVTASGQTKWAAPVTLSDVCFGCETAPAIGADNVLYVGLKDCAYAINTADGSRKWTLPIAGSAGATAIGLDGTVYFVTETKFYAISTGSTGLASSPWPKALHDRKNTANFATTLP